MLVADSKTADAPASTMVSARRGAAGVLRRGEFAEYVLQPGIVAPYVLSCAVLCGVSLLSSFSDDGAPRNNYQGRMSYEQR